MYIYQVENDKQTTALVPLDEALEHIGADGVKELIKTALRCAFYAGGVRDGVWQGDIDTVEVYCGGRGDFDIAWTQPGGGAFVCSPVERPELGEWNMIAAVPSWG